MLNSTLTIRDAVHRRELVVQNALHVCAYLFVALALGCAAIAGLAGDTFFLRLATEALIFAGLAMSVDLLLGYTGLLSLGQALFFGIGAYTSSIVLKHIAPTFWGALGATLVVATLAGFIAGVIANRTKGVYFALITFGLAQVVSKIVFNTRELGASDGIIGIPVIQADFLLFRVDSSDALGFFLLVTAILMGMYFAASYLIQTPFGRTIVAIRANESRVPFLGLNPWNYKLLAFVLAADIAALSGALYPLLRGFVSPELMFFNASGNAVITVIIGGVGTLVGALYGSVILTGLKSILGTFTEHHLIIIGVLFMLSVIFFPKGLIGYLRPRLEAWLSKRGGVA
jgi:branched-chain amino acid transport system permease protein